MTTLNGSPIAWLNRQYFDLGLLNGGKPHHYGIEFSYNSLISNTTLPYTVQVNISPFFRESLVKETGMFQYHVDHPLQLAKELRTERWEKFCEYLANYQELPNLTKLRVMNLLRSLCFHRVVKEYIPEISSAEIASDVELATLAWCRALSSLITHFDDRTFDYIQEIEAIATHAPSGSKVKINAGLQMVVEYAKTFGDLAAAEFWREVVTKDIQELKPSLNDFEFNLLMSMYYRSVSFVPFLRRDKQKVVEEMDLCESHARSLNPENELQQIVARENLSLCMESRSKESIWLKDLALAEERVRLIVQLEPLEPRYHLELAEVLTKQGKLEEAAKVYRSATRLGPPGTPVAWFMAGQCHEKIGELELASDCYLASLQIEPEAISVVKHLSNIAPRLGNPGLVNWSNLRLAELEEEQQKLQPKSAPNFQSESLSALKRSADKVLV
ncbi:tetratricopeptide repeat protein [Nostoc sp. LEGE 06077]|uniref:tetratricopeptide repeat protein n=1 Tax=Nostoc sp. LEGE 06077 TaxID=915325 RepID=UPI001880C214|nr:tetratricopeptide repeat protein [Nostoc sp. LEGE 06077]MBE9208648.1 tetratricopeptide repeat protein [Nostoc sp. LEGE 06077]